jgi:pilus assembly protein CpaC
MKTKAALITKILFIVSMSLSLSAFRAYSAGGNESAQAGYPQVDSPPMGSQETLRVSEGKSFVLNSGDVIKRVAVTNSQIADAVVISSHQVLIHGIKAGTISFLLWNEAEQVRAFDLQVVAVPMNLAPLRATLSKALPSENIQVSQSGASIVLKGDVSSIAAADQAVALAKTENGNVVNLLAAPPIEHVVMLEVKFAEVGRNALQELGINIFSTGALNTLGAVSTGQFPSITSSSVATRSELTLTDLLNVFAFRPDLNLGVLIKAMSQKKLLQILAEPNLIALDGKEASFLAGGEFPIPIAQGGGSNSGISVQYKEYGVRLKFVANCNPDSTINLKVAPEVSALDYSNAVVLSGFQIPALITRKAETEVLLKDGQSFAVAGLMDNRVNKVDAKIPWLGDVPILGYLFKSQSYQKGKTELLVMVTPHIVKPLNPEQPSPMPNFPAPFLDDKQFDGKTGKASEAKSVSPAG